MYEITVSLKKVRFLKNLFTEIQRFKVCSVWRVQLLKLCRILLYNFFMIIIIRIGDKIV